MKRLDEYSFLRFTPNLNIFKLSGFILTFTTSILFVFICKVSIIFEIVYAMIDKRKTQLRIDKLGRSMSISPTLEQLEYDYIFSSLFDKIFQQLKCSRVARIIYPHIPSKGYINLKILSCFSQKYTPYHCNYFCENGFQKIVQLMNI